MDRQREEEGVEKGKSRNNETFVIHTKKCSTGQIMGGLEGKMGERRKKRKREEDRKEWEKEKRGKVERKEISERKLENKFSSIIPRERELMGREGGT